MSSVPTAHGKVITHVYAVPTEPASYADMTSNALAQIHLIADLGHAHVADAQVALVEESEVHVAVTGAAALHSAMLSRFEWTGC